SDLGSRDQNPLPYPLATPHREAVSSLASVREEHEEREDGEDPDGQDRESADQRDQHRDEHDEHLRRGGDPASLPRNVGLQVAPEPDVKTERERGQGNRREPRDHEEDDEQSLE